MNIYNQDSMMHHDLWDLGEMMFSHFDPLPPSVMPNCGELIGQVSQRGQDTIVWGGPGLFPPVTAGKRFYSPTIHLAGGMWSLEIEPFFQNCRLVLRRQDPGPTKTFNCKVVVKGADGKEQVSSRFRQHFGERRVISECISLKILTIILHLTEVEAPLQGLKRKAEVFDNESGQVIEDESDDCRCSKAKGVMLLSKQMNDLLEKNDDCDVRFHVQDKEFPAHRVILKLRCPVFCMMLTHDSQEKKSGIIRIEDCDADAFRIFLVYLYTGKAEGLTPKKALDLYYIADKYDSSELKEKCVAFLKSSLSKTTVCDVVLLSTTHNDSELLEAATNFFVQNIKEILVTAEWQNFMSKHLSVANELYIKYANMSVLSGSMGNDGPS